MMAGEDIARTRATQVDHCGQLALLSRRGVCFVVALQGVNYGAPKYMEWYGAFGIMVTLVWLYLEILRLLSKLRSRN